MAIVTNNSILSGLSGKLGRALIFKVMGGKTIVSSYPKRVSSKPTDRQRITQNKFKNAAIWAKGILEDPLQKEHYQQQAVKLRLPNAYTAAITEYMRDEARC